MNASTPEPLDPELEALFSAERPLPSLKAEVGDRLWSSLALHRPDLATPPLSDAAPTEPTGAVPDRLPPAIAPAATAALKLSRGQLGALIGAATLGGALAGGGIDRAWREPEVVIREVVRYVEVPVAAAPPPAAVTPQTTPPAPPTKGRRALRKRAARAAPIPQAWRERERSLIDAAQSSFRAGDAKKTLELLALHRRIHPKGQLKEERDALRIRALVRLGQGPEAQRALTGFQNRYPDSLFLEALRREVDRP